MFFQPPKLSQVFILSFYHFRIPELVTQKYSSSHSDELKDLNDKLEEDTQVCNALKALNSGNAASAAGNTAGEGVRTNATPDWAGTPPQNFRKRINLTGIAMSEFESSNTLLGGS